MREALVGDRSGIWFPRGCVGYSVCCEVSQNYRAQRVIWGRCSFCGWVSMTERASARTARWREMIDRFRRARRDIFGESFPTHEARSILRGISRTRREVIMVFGTVILMPQYSSDIKSVCCCPFKVSRTTCLSGTLWYCGYMNSYHL